MLALLANRQRVMEHRMKNSEKSVRNSIRYSVNLRQCAKRAQLTFGAVAKCILLPLRICRQQQEDYLLINLRKLFQGGWESTYQQKFIEWVIQFFNVQNWAPHTNLREMYETSIMFSNTAGRTKIEENMAARLRSPFTIRDHYTRLIWCDRIFNCGRRTTIHTQEHVPTPEKCTFIYSIL
jgi:hypothetical protein